MHVCVLRVRHISPHGPEYIRTHVAPVYTNFRAAVLRCGALPPAGEAEYLNFGMPMPQIVYSNGQLPTSVDPACVVVQMVGLRGGVYVHVPYKCTYEHLVHRIIPAKLRALGVHAQDVVGNLAWEDGTSVNTRDLWSGTNGRHLWWVKLSAPVEFSWPACVERGVTMLQRRARKARVSPLAWEVV